MSDNSRVKKKTQTNKPKQKYKQIKPKQTNKQTNKSFYNMTMLWNANNYDSVVKIANKILAFSLPFLIIIQSPRCGMFCNSILSGISG